jgi:formylglycine-generating enzyme required for sulfatase activity
MNRFTPIISAFALGFLCQSGASEGVRLTLDVSHVRLSWASQSNHIYQLQYRSGASSNAWIDLGWPVQGKGGIETLTDAAPAAGRIYRVIEPTNAVITTNMIWLPPGTFTMPITNNAYPIYEMGLTTEVTLSQGFWMGVFEVTQQEYLDVTGGNPSYYRGTHDPVHHVTWQGATNYCARLSARERAAGRIPASMEYRLPTEAEWEYACRAGTTTWFEFGNDPTSTEIANYAWYADNSGSITHTVGHRVPNRWGLYDMHGSVWEWCSNWYTPVYPEGSVTDPLGPPTGTEKPARGGGFAAPAEDCGSVTRNHWPPSGWIPVDFGFRVVLGKAPPLNE